MNPSANDTLAPNGTAAAETVGLIGLGLMGSALAERLAVGGFRVVGYDLDAARGQFLAGAGGQSAEDPAAVLGACGRVVLSLPDSLVVREVFSRAGAHLRPGHLLIDTTTGDPADAAVLGERMAGRGVAYLDATISGSSAQVRAGEAVVMAGGDAAAFDRAADLFRTFARRAFHVGPCGGGSTMKLVTNLVLGLNRAALAEGLWFARLLGLDAAQALAVLKDSPAHSRIMDTKGEKMLAGDFAPQAKLSQHLKDVRLILAAGAAAGAALPLSDAHRRLLEAAEAAGLGPLDNSAIIRAFAALPAAETAVEEGG